MISRREERGGVGEEEEVEREGKMEERGVGGEKGSDVASIGEDKFILREERESERDKRISEEN